MALVRLNRPDKRNALTGAMLERLAELFAGLEQRHDLRAVIITGAGPDAFSAGTDIKELASLDVEGARRAGQRCQDVAPY